MHLHWLVDLAREPSLIEIPTFATCIGASLRLQSGMPKFVAKHRCKTDRVVLGVLSSYGTGRVFGRNST